jgi:hypothetical protein
MDKVIDLDDDFKKLAIVAEKLDECFQKLIVDLKDWEAYYKVTSGNI